MARRARQARVDEHLGKTATLVVLDDADNVVALKALRVGR